MSSNKYCDSMNSNKNCDSVNSNKNCDSVNLNKYCDSVNSNKYCDRGFVTLHKRHVCQQLHYIPECTFQLQQLSYHWMGQIQTC